MNFGDTFDRYTINYIKKCNKKDEVINIEKVTDLITELIVSNMMLWELEDEIREPEQKLEYLGEVGLKIAETNDRRCEIKNELNELIDSSLREEKIYKNNA